MKRSTILKAAAGATALFILGSGVAYAANTDPTDATDKTTATVTVNQTRSIALVASSGTNYTVSGSLDRGGSVSLTNASATYQLDYTTDNSGFVTAAGGTTPCAWNTVTCTNDRVTVAATADADSSLGATKIKLTVTPVLQDNLGGNAPTLTPVDITALNATTGITLSAGLNGIAQRIHHVVNVAFAAAAGVDAEAGTHSVQLTYSIGATPNAA